MHNDNNKDDLSVSWWQWPFYGASGADAAAARNTNNNAKASSTSAVALIEEYKQHSQKDQTTPSSTHRMVSLISRVVC